jgi:hypothetical protein
MFKKRRDASKVRKYSKSKEEKRWLIYLDPFDYVRSKEREDWSIYWILTHVTENPGAAHKKLIELADHVEKTGGAKDEVWKRISSSYNAYWK